MAIEFLNSAADFAHLDGTLVYPLFIDGHHVLVTEDGVTLLLPNGLRVEYAGRFGIDVQSGVPFVDTRVTGKEAHLLARWGEQLQSAHVLDVVRTRVAEALSGVRDPDGYINREEKLK